MSTEPYLSSSSSVPFDVYPRPLPARPPPPLYARRATMHFEKTLGCLLKAVRDEDDRIASLVVDCAEICGILDLGLSLAIVSRVVQRHAAAGTTRAMLSVGSVFHGILISACIPMFVTSSGKHTDAKMWYDMIVPRPSSAGLTVSEQGAQTSCTMQHPINTGAK